MISRNKFILGLLILFVIVAGAGFLYAGHLASYPFMSSSDPRYVCANSNQFWNAEKGICDTSVYTDSNGCWNAVGINNVQDISKFTFQSCGTGYTGLYIKRQTQGQSPTCTKSSIAVVGDDCTSLSQTCGNGYCGYGENQTNCPADCTSPPTQNQTYPYISSNDPRYTCADSTQYWNYEKGICDSAVYTDSNGCWTASGVNDVQDISKLTFQSCGTGYTGVYIKEQTQGQSPTCTKSSKTTIGGNCASTCGDSYCGGGETRTSCAVDCNPLCGNGVTETSIGEQCDSGSQNGVACTPSYGGNCQYCNTNCQLATNVGPGCGDSIVQTQNGEVCDGGANCIAPGQTNQCQCPSGYYADGANGCTTIPPGCGNGVIDSGETCDGSNLNSKTCQTEGFTGGSLSCTSSCQVDTSQCTGSQNTYCGDGVVQNPDTNGVNEQCDGGPNCVQSTCQCPSGYQAGFGNGCTPIGSTCGNGAIDAGEQCDSNNFAGQSCTTIGYTGGTLGCSTSCQFNTSSCTPSKSPSCGDGTIESPSEQCDGSLFGGASCAYGGYSGGTLSCTSGSLPSGCQYDYSLCNNGTSSCTLTSASWSTTGPVEEGNNVTLTVQGTNCDGKTVSFVVWEDDILSADDPVQTNPSDVVFSGNTATGRWVTEWQDDGSTGGDPEYYFIASVSGSGSISSSTSAELSVTKSTEVQLQCSQKTTCSDYTTAEDCTKNLCGVSQNSVPAGVSCDPTSGNNCYCSWDIQTSSCKAKVDVEAGSCIYTQTSNDDCSDGFLDFSWTALWSPGTGENNSDLQLKCVDGSKTIECPAQIALPFFNFWNLAVAAIAIALIYWAMSMKHPHTRKK